MDTKSNAFSILCLYLRFQMTQNVMYKKFTPFYLLAIVITLFSCTKEKVDYGTDFTRGYYPLKFGKYVVYDVDSTLWDDFLKVKTLHHYQMRYLCVDTFRDNQFRVSYRMDVAIRLNNTLPWKEHHVFYVTETSTHLEYVEDNLRFIKLVFPISNNITWDGNSMIPTSDQDYTYFQGWLYKYANRGLGYNNGSTYYDNAVTVTQIDDALSDPELHPDTYAYKTFSEEVYGFDIGMIYREMTHWTYQPTIGYRSGYSVIMRAVDHN